MTGAEIFYGATAAAAIVLSGALYALFFALGRLNGAPLYKRLAWVAYALFAASTYMLAGALDLSGVWLLVIAAMLVGYLAAPAAIWHLCAATHLENDPKGRHESTANG